MTQLFGVARASLPLVQLNVALAGMFVHRDPVEATPTHYVEVRSLIVPARHSRRRRHEQRKVPERPGRGVVPQGRPYLTAGCGGHDLQLVVVGGVEGRTSSDHQGAEVDPNTIGERCNPVGRIECIPSEEDSERDCGWPAKAAKAGAKCGTRMRALAELEALTKDDGKHHSHNDEVRLYMDRDITEWRVHRGYYDATVSDAAYGLVWLSRLQFFVLIRLPLYHDDLVQDNRNTLCASLGRFSRLLQQCLTRRGQEVFVLSLLVAQEGNEDESHHSLITAPRRYHGSRFHNRDKQWPTNLNMLKRPSHFRAAQPAGRPRRYQIDRGVLAGAASLWSRPSTACVHSTKHFVLLSRGTFTAFLTEVSDIFSFSLTCSTFKPIATRCLLSMRPVSLRGDASIPRFHSFLFANAPATHPTESSLLLEILTSCPQLERISLFLGDCYPSYLPDYTSNMHVMRAITAIQSLRSLSLKHTGRYEPEEVGILLRPLHAPLRTLRIHCGSEAGLWEPDALERLLSCLALTLEELELDNLVLDADALRTSPRPISTMTQYPAVRSLTVSKFFGRPLADHLRHLFPALDGTLPRHARRTETAEATRARTRGQRSSTGSTAMCTCSTRWACVVRSGSSFSTVRSRLIRSVTPRKPCARTRLPRLKQSLMLERSDDLGVFDGLFPREVAETLAHLTLFLHLYCVSEGGQQARADAGGGEPPTVFDVRWDDLRNTLASSLQPLRELTHPFVTSHSNAYLDSDPSTSCSRSELERTAAALVRPLPSLRCLFLVSRGNLARREGGSPASHWEIHERWHALRAYRVRGRVAEPPAGSTNIDGTAAGLPGAGEERVLVELHSDDDVAETILEKEGLGFLSGADEKACRMHASLLAASGPSVEEERRRRRRRR
ncbi:hypothetical protein LXA43DRAFT_1082710, partial [Ganoderma leucocontextum]